MKASLNNKENDAEIFNSLDIHLFMQQGSAKCSVGPVSDTLDLPNRNLVRGGGLRGGGEGLDFG